MIETRLCGWNIKHHRTRWPIQVRDLSVVIHSIPLPGKLEEQREPEHTKIYKNVQKHQCNSTISNMCASAFSAGCSQLLHRRPDNRGSSPGPVALANKIGSFAGNQVLGPESSMMCSAQFLHGLTLCGISFWDLQENRM